MAPSRSRAITQADKLKAISNLQSEITRRARSLRAEYARVAQSLRSKLDMRIYRIPKALRKAKMRDLLQKYFDAQELKDPNSLRQSSPLKDTTQFSQATAGSPGKPVPAKLPGAKATKAALKKAPDARIAQSTAPAKLRGVKRGSDAIIAADNMTDKENESIENPKKRNKARTDTAPARTLRDPSNILSPKSNNSRTLPQSPVRPAFGVPTKGFAPRPASPLKSAAGPMSPTRPATDGKSSAVTGAAKSAPTRANKATTASTRAGATSRAAKATARAVSSSSNNSAGTVGTTIVKRGATSRAGTASSAAKKAATGGTTASTRRTAATKAKAEAPVADPGARRVLRKRA